jgi:hypothetical protein
LMIAGDGDKAQNQRRDQEYAQLSPVHGACSRIYEASSSFNTALQRSQTVGYVLSSPTWVE